MDEDALDRAIEFAVSLGYEPQDIAEMLIEDFVVLMLMENDLRS